MYQKTVANGHNFFVCQKSIENDTNSFVQNQLTNGHDINQNGCAAEELEETSDFYSKIKETQGNTDVLFKNQKNEQNINQNGCALTTPITNSTGTAEDWDF